MPQRRAPLRLNALTVAKMIRYWQDCPATVHELAEVCGLGVSTTRRYVLALEKEGAIHVTSWEQDGLNRYTTKVYTFGPGKNQARPKPVISLAQRRKDRKARASSAFEMARSIA